MTIKRPPHDVTAHIETWNAILLGQKTHGDPERDPRDQARDYHTEHLLDWELDQTRLAFLGERGGEAPRVDVLVSMVGFSPETTVSTAHTLRPRHLVLVYSKKSHKNLNHIHEQLVTRRGVLTPGNITSRLCDAADPADIYKVIHAALDEARHLLDIEPEHASEYIDITGGKKVMSATSALVAWQLDLNICYIDSDIDPVTRKPAPGSTRVIELGNPMTIFGAEELAVGERLFDAGNHGAAREHFDAMRRRVTDPGPANARLHLADLYAAWSGLDFAGLSNFIPRVQTDLRTQRLILGTGQLAKLEHQLTYLTRLVADTDARPRALLASYHMLGGHYDDLGRHDFAALLFYRTIESTLQSRLELAHGIDASEPDYSGLPEGTRERWAELNAIIYGGEPATFDQPYKLGLMASVVLLAALSDPLITRVKLGEVKGLQNLRRLSDTRNRSVLAHGHETIQPAQLHQLRHLAGEFVTAIDALHPGEFAGADSVDRLRFIRFGG